MSSVYLKGMKKSGIFFVGILFIFVLFLFPHNQAKVKDKSAEEKVIEKKCTICHSIDRIFFLKRTPEEWSAIVKRMKEKEPNWFSDEDKKDKVYNWLKDEDVYDAVHFLKLNYVKTGREFFGPLCVSCHAIVGKKQLLYQRKTRPAWARSIERMQRKYSNFIGVSDARKIYEFWTNPDNNKNLKNNLEETDMAEGVFEDKCGMCHTHQFIYGQKRTKQDWQAILNRMQIKSPSWIAEKDLGQIKKYMLSDKRFLLPDRQE